MCIKRLYRYMYVRTYVCMYVSMYLCIYYLCIHVSMYVCMYLCMYLLQKKVLMKYSRSFTVVVLIVQRMQNIYEQSFIVSDVRRLFKDANFPDISGIPDFFSKTVIFRILSVFVYIDREDCRKLFGFLCIL